MKKMPVLISIIISIMAAGCVPKEAALTLTPLSPALTLYGWADYVPQVVLDAFTEEFGVEITYEIYQSMEDAVIQLRDGQVYDVVILENNNIKPLAAEGLLAEIDYQNLANYKNISPNFRGLAFDPNNQYSVPYDYGTTGLVIRGDLVKTPITRWADLWDPQFKGKVAVRPLAYELIGVALKSLGYSLNSENPQELEKALRHLLELKPSLIFVDDETRNAIPVLLNGDAVIMLGWGNDALMARQENDAVQYILPEEGTLLWGESFVIPSNSSHKYTAELFLNFLLRPQISAQITNESQYATANEAAYPFINPEIFNNQIIFPPAKTLEKADWYMPLTPAGEKLYAGIWERFLAGPP